MSIPVVPSPGPVQPTPGVPAPAPFSPTPFPTNPLPVRPLPAPPPLAPVKTLLPPPPTCVVTVLGNPDDPKPVPPQYPPETISRINRHHYSATTPAPSQPVANPSVPGAYGGTASGPTIPILNVDVRSQKAKPDSSIDTRRGKPSSLLLLIDGRVSKIPGWLALSVSLGCGSTSRTERMVLIESDQRIVSNLSVVPNKLYLNRIPWKTMWTGD